MKRKNMSLMAVLIILVLSLCLLAGCAGEPAAPVALSDNGVLTLRVNPGIAVHYDGGGLVTELKALNEDGAVILKGYGDFIGKECRQVVKELVLAIDEAGYFVEDIDGNNRNIIIQIEPGSVLPQEGFLAAITADVQEGIGQKGLNSKILGIGDSDYDERYAKEDSASPYITMDKAKEIALAAAGVAAADARFDDREFDFENGIPVFELEFTANGREYEYNIDAKSGQILTRSGQNNSQYGDSDYGPNSDGVTEYGFSDYGDTDYGVFSDGVTDYNENDSDYGPNNDGVTDYNDTDYGPNNDGVTDYNDSDYGPNNDGVTDYNDTDYGPNNDGVTDYNDSNYGSNNTSNNSSSDSNYGSNNSSNDSSSNYDDDDDGDSNYDD